MSKWQTAYGSIGKKHVILNGSKQVDRSDIWGYTGTTPVQDLTESHTRLDDKNT